MTFCNISSVVKDIWRTWTLGFLLRVKKTWIMNGNPNSLYVTLFSNTSMKVYPDNYIGAFTVQLAHMVDLGTDKWEVGLCEFLCPPLNVGTFKSIIIVGDRNGLFYGNFMSTDLFCLIKSDVYEHIFTQRFSVIMSLKMCITCSSKDKSSETFEYKFRTWQTNGSPSTLESHLRKSTSSARFSMVICM